MTAPDTPTTKARRNFLAALDDMRLTSKLLREFLVQAEATTPDLMESHASNDLLEAIETTRSQWSDKYYSRQKLCTERNFSRERLGHLIEIRDYFRQEGYKGFVPQALNHETSGMDQPSHARRHEGAPFAYQPSVNLKKFVDEGDLRTIRTALRLELNDNRISGQDLRGALAWLKAKVPDLCVPYAEKAFAREMDPDRNRWVMDYYDNQTVYLKTNFSEERFLHLVEVREHLRELGVEGFVAIATPSIPSTQPALRPRATSSTSDPAPSAPRPDSRSTGRELSPVFRIALLVGGALAAVVIYLSLVK
jgi:hypothetical protein